MSSNLTWDERLAALKLREYKQSSLDKVRPVSTFSVQFHNWLGTLAAGDSNSLQLEFPLQSPTGRHSFARRWRAFCASVKAERPQRFAAFWRAEPQWQARLRLVAVDDRGVTRWTLSKSFSPQEVGTAATASATSVVEKQELLSAMQKFVDRKSNGG